MKIDLLVGNVIFRLELGQVVVRIDGIITQSPIINLSLGVEEDVLVDQRFLSVSCETVDKDRVWSSSSIMVVEDSTSWDFFWSFRSAWGFTC